MFDANQKFKDLLYSKFFRGRLEHIRAIYFITPDGNVLSIDNSFYSIYQVNEHNYKEVIQEVDRRPLKMSWFTEQQAIYRAEVGFRTPVRASVTAARRLIDSNTRQLRGYLFVQFNDLFLKEYLDKVQIGATGSILVSANNGDVLYQQNPQLLHVLP